MITAVDTNVLLDVLTADPTFGPASRTALQAAIQTGALIASEVVWAETSAWFRSEEETAHALDRLRVRLVPMDVPAAFAAGTAWGAYRRRGGRRDRMIADFLVGAHAEANADRLLTRDYGFYRARFRGLKIVDPTAG
ncbi:MAG TPA: type II toxin-antitoxin system VapC family toxin [Conexibacter sp.]|jgi:predicted nucleic acid-binding protein|nr:type II toxin-antitoxin system VapC family toxin [Conexibacter sp.]